MEKIKTILEIGILVFLALLLENFVMENAFELTDNATGAKMPYWIGLMLLLGVLSFLNRGYISITYETHKFYKRYSLFLIVSYILILVSSLINQLPSRIYYLQLVMPIVALYCSYISIQKQQSFKIIASIYLLFFCYMIWVYYQSFQILSLLSTLTITYRNSGSYEILILLPILLCFSNKHVRWGSFVIMGIVMITCLKRGGFIAYALGVLMYICCYLSNKGKSISVKYIIALALLIYIIPPAIEYFDGQLGGAFFRRFTESDDYAEEGRSSIYVITLEMFTNSNIFQIIFGHGFNRVVHDSPLHLSAHNDFLEVIYDYGIICFAIYLSVYIYMIKLLFSQIKQKSRYAPPLAFSLSVFIVLSLVSHIVKYPIRLIEFSIVWGCLLGLISREKDIIN